MLAMGTTSCGGSDDDGKGVDTKVTVTAQPTSYAAKADGGSFELTVNASRDWSVFATNSEPWITVKPSSGMAGSATVTVSVAANSTYEPREGQVTVLCGMERAYVSISQEASERPVETYPCPIEGYRLVWQDEFDGNDLSTDWTYEVQKDHWVNNELQNYVAGESPEGNEVVTVKDGILSINCFKEGSKIYSGRIYAKKSKGWKYCYAEASICLPKGKGTWPAFWMMPVKFTSWPADGEIDIMEEVGANPNYVSSSLHANSHVHSNNTQVTHEMYCKGAEGEFHKYAIEWRHDCITTYVDGKVQLEYKNRGLGHDDWPYDAAFYLILNLAWGGDWGGYRGIDESALPVSMKVDYVRVWQKE